MVKHYSQGVFLMRLTFTSVDFMQIAFQNVGGLTKLAEGLNGTKDRTCKVRENAATDNS